MNYQEFAEMVSETNGGHGRAVRVTAPAPATYELFAAMVIASFAATKELPSAYITAKGTPAVLYIPSVRHGAISTYAKIPFASVAQWLTIHHANKSETFYTLTPPVVAPASSLSK
jgi:hypothetical protein